MNPEFKRNLWLELSPQRLIAMPVILGAIFAVTVSVSHNSLGLLATVGSFLFGAFAYLWGTRRAAASLGDEVRGGTWDAQRMAAISPWSMTWGKLFGSTAFVWYGGLIALAVKSYADVQEIGVELALLQAAISIMSALLAQAASLAIALAFLQKQRGEKKVPVTLSQLFGLVVGFGLTGPVMGLSTILGRNDVVEWYGQQFLPHEILLVSLVIFATCAMASAYRQMRGELQCPSWPWGWPALALVGGIYVNGFIPGDFDGPFAIWLFGPFLVLFGVFYASLLLSVKDPVRVTAFKARLATRGFGAALQVVPGWVPVILLMGLLALAVEFAMSGTFRLPFRVGSLTDSLGLYMGRFESGYPLALFAFALRDLAIVLLVNLGRGRRPDMAAFIYLVLLYLLPAVLVVGFVAPGLGVWFVPKPGHGIFAFIAPLIEAGVLWMLVVWRWRAMLARTLASSGSTE